MTQTDLQPLDLEMCFGKRPAGYRVDQLIGYLPAVLIGDVLAVDHDAVRPVGCYVAFMRDASERINAGVCERGATGGLWIRVGQREAWRFDQVRVLGVVTGLIRTFPAARAGR